MKTIAILILSFAFSHVKSQSLVGSWQITKQTSCLESEVSDTLKTDENMMKDFSSKSKPSSKIVKFNIDNSGEELIKKLEKKKPTSVKKFHYKFDGTTIYILDKKSRLIVSSMSVETLTSDSLVYNTSGKSCEKVMLVRTP